VKVASKPGEKRKTFFYKVAGFPQAKFNYALNGTRGPYTNRYYH
jgi:hypothetical protein